MAAIKLSELDHIIEKHSSKKGSLIPVLHEIQEEIGYLLTELQRYVSQILGVAMSKIYGVISFIHFLQLSQKVSIQLESAWVLPVMSKAPKIF